MAPGTYLWRAGGATPADITFTIPSGWISRFGVPHKDRDGPGEVAVGNWIIGNVYADPCQWQGSLLDPAIGPTIDDLATALRAQRHRNATAPTDVTLGGYPAKRIELSVPADLAPATCDEGVMRTWVDPSDPGDKWFSDEPEARGLRSGQLNVVYIVDVQWRPPDHRHVAHARHVRRGPGGARCSPGVDAHPALTIKGDRGLDQDPALSAGPAQGSFLNGCARLSVVG